MGNATAELMQICARYYLDNLDKHIVSYSLYHYLLIRLAT